MNPDHSIVEARAKITWGESAESVRSFLTANGMSATGADAAIQELVAERNKDIKSIGVKRTIIGGALVVGTAIFFYWSYHNAHIDKMSYRDARGFATVAILIAVTGFYGFGKLVDGIKDLIRPESDEESLSDIS